jgi:hypothetical protein
MKYDMIGVHNHLCIHFILGSFRSFDLPLYSTMLLILTFEMETWNQLLMIRFNDINAFKLELDSIALKLREVR